MKGEPLNHKPSAISAGERQLLLQRAQTGDPEALNVLFESCRRRLYCLALRILVRPQDAEDAVQEAMLAAFTHLDRFQGRADFLTWASRIVINAALRDIRKTRAKPLVSLDRIDDEFERTPLREHLKDPQPTPEEQLQGVEYRQILKDALQKVPIKSRRAIQLCKFGDYSLKEAASALGLPVGTVKARLHRGRRELTINLKRGAQIRCKQAASRQNSSAASPNLPARPLAWL